MELWLWVAVGALACVILILTVKLLLLRRSAREIAAALSDRLATDTNTLIDISGRDRVMRQLAATLNTQLRQLRSERRRLQQGDRALKEAVTNVSHDLRTPLTAMGGYLDLLDREELPETVRRYLAQIQNRTDAMKQLTEELFHYSLTASGEAPAVQRIDLRRALEESVLSFYGAMQQRGITPVVTLPEERVERLLDPAALGRVFSNIISNALKYSDGDLRVEMDTAGEVTFSNTAEALTPVAVKQLFHRFYTVETGRHATGLGLSIAKQLTERMGGSITADYQRRRLLITVRFPQTKISEN